MESSTENDDTQSWQSNQELESQPSNNGGDDGNQNFRELSSAKQFSSYTIPENRIIIAWDNLTVRAELADGSKGNGKSRQSSTCFAALKRRLFSTTNQNWNPKTNTKVLLQNVYGIAKPGSILAIIGSSGAGKSTLMNILMGRISSKLTLQGKVKVNGATIGRNITKVSAYLQQHDVFHPNLTVGEHLWFHARLRMPGDRYVDSDRHEKIDSILHELGLTLCKDVLIGGQSGEYVGKKTLSGGERKRLAFATEILTNPSILFCDEPTTGLDSFMAENVVSSMKYLAERGKTVVCTLHQPSSQIVQLLDNVLVLSEGRVVYLGCGKRMASYFASLGHECPSGFNIFDHVLAVLSTPSIKFKMPVDGSKSSAPQPSQPDAEQFQENEDNVLRAETIIAKAEALTQLFHNSKHYKKICGDIKEGLKFGASGISLEKKIESGLDPATPLMQYKMCLWREVKTALRNRRTFASRIIYTIFYVLIFSLTFPNQQYDQEGVMNFIGLLFQMVRIAIWENVEAYSLSIPEETPIYLREQQQRIYTPFAYFLSRMLVEIPQIFTYSFVFVTIVYFSCNLVQTTVEHYFYAVLIHALGGWCACGIGYLIGFSVDHIAVASTVRRTIGPFLGMTAGIFVNLATMPVWISWTRFISPNYYTSELLQVNQWSSVTSLDCSNADTSTCFKDGASVLEFYNFSVDNVTRNIMALVTMTIGLRLAAFVALLIRTKRHTNDS